MKKYLIAIVICLIALIVNAQDTIPQVSVSLVYDDIKTALAKIATPLAESAKYAFEIIVKKQFWQGIGTLILTIISIILSILCIRKFIEYKNLDNYYQDIDGIQCLIGIIFLGIFASSVICIALLPDTLMHIFTPEYYAIKDLLEMVNK